MDTPSPVLKKDIIIRINEALGQDLVEEIKFKIGTIGTTMRLR